MIIECEICEALTSHAEQGSFEGFNDEEGCVERYILLECPVCHSAATARQSKYGEEMTGPRPIGSIHLNSND